MKRNFEQSIAIDTRTLAVFRVFVGLLVLADLVLRSRNFSYFYSEDGVAPQSLAESMTPDNAFSFYYFTTDSTLIAALMVIQALIAIQLILGYKTTIATLLSFLFVISLDHHNPLVLSYADTLFRLLLFWAIFLPLGERWSIDALHADWEPRTQVASIASALILCQMVAMYFVNAYHKSMDPLWTGGEATPLIMGLDNTTFLLGEFMRNFPTLLQFGGLTWYYMLWFSWLLIFLPGRWRMLLVGMFMVAHASFAITVRIGAFPYVALAGVMLFLQTQFWIDLRTVGRYLGVDEREFRTRLEGLRRVGRYFPRVRPYDRRRKQAGAYLHSIGIGAVVIALVMFTLLSYAPVGGVDERQTEPQQEIEDVADRFNIDQPTWSIFAPTPRTTDRYYVFPAQTADGEVIDVYNEREMTYDRPGKELQKQFGTYRERFYMNSVRRAGFDGQASVLKAEYLCTTWADENDVELTHVNMYQVRENVTMDTIDTPEDRDRYINIIYQHGCGDNEPIDIAPPE
ncbi:HTTM domain-containing protein [Natrononativus amylolyticus]|uniref:HTTM domain-containing protein n=1 Tax=Natrononativus amylolyticus TaxID=2963434 RepID=UPI0020CBA473|nr:HTTM domain-containing protein [Natrononativus amylolyticus]